MTKPKPPTKPKTMKAWVLIDSLGFCFGHPRLFPTKRDAHLFARNALGFDEGLVVYVPRRVTVTVSK